MIKNRKESAGLARLRDWLLPMLMNGQVSVNYHLADRLLLLFRKITEVEDKNRFGILFLVGSAIFFFGIVKIFIFAGKRRC
jgi:hypothetical protein